MPQPELVAQQLAQLPADALPTLHMTSRLPGMGERTYDNHGDENTRVWFGNTEINRTPITLGVAASSNSTHFLLSTQSTFELWELEERSCSEITMRRRGAGYRPTLVPDAIMDRADDDQINSKFLASLNFCNEEKADFPYCKDCIFKDGQNSDIRLDGVLWKGTLNPGIEPQDFPIRRVADIRERTIYKDVKSSGIYDGFSGTAQVVEAMESIRDAILKAEQITFSQAVEMIPNEVLRVSNKLRQLLRPKKVE